MWCIHEVRGWYTSAEEIFAEAVHLAGSRPDSEGLRLLVAMAEIAQSWFVALLGRPDAGVVLADRSTATLRDLGNTEELSFAYSLMFMCLFLSAQPSRMQQIGQESLEMSDDPWIKVNTHVWLSFAARMAGDSDKLEHHTILSESLIGSTNYWQLYWWQLGKVLSALDEGDFASGREILENMLTTVKTINMKRGLHHTLYNLGITARALEDYGLPRHISWRACT